LFVSLFPAAVGREKPLAPKIRLSPESESGGRRGRGGYVLARASTTQSA